MVNILGLNINIKNIIIAFVYILIGVIIYTIISHFVNKATVFRKKHLNKEQSQKVKTIQIITLNISKYLISIFVLLAILALYGVNVKSILAGLGIGTAIIGLAFQDLAKDIIAGIFIITEGQYEVGDTIEIDGFMGEVISVGLKTTKIKNFKGAVKIVSNRNMDKIINYSMNNSLAVVDIGVSYDHSPKDVEAVLSKLFKKLSGTIKEVKGDYQILGVEGLNDNCVTYRIAVEVESMQQFTIERKLKREIKIAFDEANIKIPYPQIEVHNNYGKK